MTQHLYRKQHVVTSVVAVIVDERERVLLTRRAVVPFRDMWVMPGGKIHLGEPILQALHREVQEEVGIEVSVEGLVDVFEHLTPGAENDHFVILYYRCRPVTRDVAPDPAEVAEARWVPRAELPSFEMTEGTRFILGQVFPDGPAAALPQPERPAADHPAERRMVQILDREVDLDFPLGHHLHCLVAQIPVRLRRTEHGYEIAEREEQWRTVRSVLDLAAAGDQNLKKLHFLVFPEASVPFDRLDDALAAIARGLRPNTVTMFGLEHVRLRTYRDLLARFREDNAVAIDLVQRDIDSSDILDIPVNACCVAVKESSGRLRVFLEAKTHPFAGEEFLDKVADLYRGRHFYLFRGRPSCFNFMVLVCLDYLYRNLYASNIRRIIDHANELFFASRQTLDTLFVIQCNPKPEHRAYWEVLSAFYGEYLEDTPGVRETVTVFGNCARESRIDGYGGNGTFGRSSVVISRHHKLAAIRQPEFSTDDFAGAPLCRLRFGDETRLFYFNLPLHHELDPRSTRLPLKIHRIMRPARGGGWEQVSEERMDRELVLPREPTR